MNQNLTAIAKDNMVRISPTKLSFLVNSIVNLKVNSAINQLKFSSKRISRNINSSGSKDRLILQAAHYYKHRWTQAEFKMLSDSVSSSEISDRITALAASQIGKPRRSGAFYDSQLGYGSKSSKFKLEVEWSKDD